MNHITAPMSATNLAVLDRVQTLPDTTSEKAVVVESLSEQVTGAFAVSRAFLTQIQDPEYRANVDEKLKRSNVRGSKVIGINGHDDVATMLEQCGNWEEIVANLKDKEIRVLQGELPDGYNAFAAYATVEEIDRVYGKDGLAKIETKRGYQTEGEYYRSTMLTMRTRIITVQLKKDASRVEYLHQWFAGREITSILYRGERDGIVRCNSQLQPVEQKPINKGHASKPARSHRAH